jgi:CBS domain-containing protein
MRKVSQILQGKDARVVSVTRDTPVLEMIRLMADEHTGSVLVMQGNDLIGIATERDYARKVILQGRSSSQTAVSDIMSGNPLTVGPDTDVFDCMRLCTDSRIRHLPVVQDGKVVGVISIGDLVKAVIDAQAEQIEHLQRYITS